MTLRRPGGAALPEHSSFLGIDRPGDRMRRGGKSAHVVADFSRNNGCTATHQFAGWSVSSSTVMRKGSMR